MYRYLLTLSCYAKACKHSPPSPITNSRSPRGSGRRRRHSTTTQPTVTRWRPLPPPPKKSCLDKMRNATARAVARIRAGHWRLAEYLKRIRKRPVDKFWFCQGRSRMARSHVLLHCPGPRLVVVSHRKVETLAVSRCCYRT